MDGFCTWFPLWSTEEEVRQYIFEFYSKLKAYESAWLPQHSAATCHPIQFTFFFGPSFIFQQDNDPKHNSVCLRLGCVRARRVMVQPHVRSTPCAAPHVQIPHVQNKHVALSSNTTCAAHEVLYMCSFVVFFSENLQSKNHENKGNVLNKMVCPNLWFEL